MSAPFNVLSLRIRVPPVKHDRSDTPCPRELLPGEEDRDAEMSPNPNYGPCAELAPTTGVPSDSPVRVVRMRIRAPLMAPKAKQHNHNWRELASLQRVNLFGAFPGLRSFSGKRNI